MPFYDESELNPIIDSIKEAFPKATHYCFAYRIGTDGNRFRANDDGEPSGSAGRPILASIDSAGVTCIIVVVVRYYGGTNLGVPGLIHAYRESGKLAIENASKITKEYVCIYTLTFGYENMGQILNALKELHIAILEKTFEETCILQCAIPLLTHTVMIHKLKAHILGISIDQVNEATKIPDCELQYRGVRW